jgi:hypothetical protein
VHAQVTLRGVRGQLSSAQGVLGTHLLSVWWRAFTRHAMTSRALAVDLEIWSMSKLRVFLS